MKCLLITTGAFHSDGGIAALNRLTLYTLAQEECSILILSLSESDSRVDERYFTQSDPPRMRVFGGNKYRFSAAVWREVLFHHHDLIIVDHVNLASILAPLSRFGICRYAVWLCGIEVFAPRPDFEGRLGLKYADKRLAISQYTFQKVRDQFPALKVGLCELGLDPLQWAEANQPSPSKALEFESVNGERQSIGERLILHVGRMPSSERYKGQEALLRAFPMIKHKFPEAQLMLAGEGDDRERLLSKARSYPDAVQKSIFMPGYVASDLLNKVYGSCFVFAMPSTGEGFGLVYLEAMARGKPCLGGKLDATPCVVRDGITGILVEDPKDYNQVAVGLMEFFNNPQKAYEMGKAGYELVKSHYLPQHFAERFWRALGVDA